MKALTAFQSVVDLFGSRAAMWASRSMLVSSSSPVSATVFTVGVACWIGAGPPRSPSSLSTVAGAGAGLTVAVTGVVSKPVLAPLRA
jgi:hypothetical protein